MNQKNIEEILLRMGVPANVMGFRYIVDAMLFLDQEETAGETLEIRAQIAWLTGEMLADVRARIGRAEQEARAAQEALAEHKSRRKGFWFQR